MVISMNLILQAIKSMFRKVYMISDKVEELANTKVDKSQVTDTIALEILMQADMISPIADSDGLIFISEDGSLYCL
jgi:hypothetical protein